MRDIARTWCIFLAIVGFSWSILFAYITIKLLVGGGWGLAIFAGVLAVGFLVIGISRVAAARRRDPEAFGVDALLLVGFDVYMRCREKVYEVRYDQLKKLNHVMLERANRMPRRAKLQETSETEPDDRGDEG